MEWISVEDRLPEENELVLMWEPDFGEKGVVENGYFTEDKVFSDSYGELNNDVVTHWMPLPPPPDTNGKGVRL